MPIPKPSRLVHLHKGSSAGILGLFFMHTTSKPSKLCSLAPSVLFAHVCLRGRHFKIHALSGVSVFQRYWCSKRVFAKHFPIGRSMTEMGPNAVFECAFRTQNDEIIELVIFILLRRSEHYPSIPHCILLKIPATT